MRTIFLVFILGIGLLGCATQNSLPDNKAASESKPQKVSITSPGKTATRPAASLSVTNQGQVITLTESMVGKVAAVNPALRFVVLDFSLNPLPPIDQRLAIYRQGNKVGEVRVTGPERNGNIVADITRGEAQAGDEVRRE